MGQTIESKNKTTCRQKLSTRSSAMSKRDYEAAERYWSPNYIQHSAHIPPGRDGLFNLIKSVPPTLRYESGTRTAVAEGDFVILQAVLVSSWLQETEILATMACNFKRMANVLGATKLMKVLHNAC